MTLCCKRMPAKLMDNLPWNSLDIRYSTNDGGSHKTKVTTNCTVSILLHILKKSLTCYQLAGMTVEECRHYYLEYKW